MFATPATVLSAAATLISVLIVIYTFAQAGRLRGRHGVKAPAMSGHPQFERAVRVQMNTIEQFAIFLPLLWLATIYFRFVWAGWVPAALGIVWCIGRIVYSVGYMADPERRHFGFAIGALSSIALLILAVVGIIQTWVAVHAI